jgi:hypothetical protein
MTDFPHVQPAALTNLRLHLRHCPLCVGDKLCPDGVELTQAWQKHKTSHSKAVQEGDPP